MRRSQRDRRAVRSRGRRRPIAGPSGSRPPHWSLRSDASSRPRARPDPCPRCALRAARHAAQRLAPPLHHLAAGDFAGREGRRLHGHHRERAREQTPSGGLGRADCRRRAATLHGAGDGEFHSVILARWQVSAVLVAAAGRHRPHLVDPHGCAVGRGHAAHRLSHRIVAARWSLRRLLGRRHPRHVHGRSARGGNG